MRSTFTQDQLDLEKTVRSLAEADRGRARAALEQGWGETAGDVALRRDFGVLGVPESAGGVGSSLVDLMVAVEALGRQLSASSYVAHAAAVQLLVDSGLPLDDALEGRVRWTPAVDPLTGHPETRTLVPCAAGVDAFAVHGPSGVRLATRAIVTERESFDPSRPMADVVAEPGTAVPAGRGLQRATLVAAAELCGVAQGAIDLAAGYARQRTQFGRVIGSFQAVAFQLVDAVVARKAAWDLTLHAAWAVEHDRPEAELQVHAAKAAAGKAACFAAERCIQVHGGMGITMEADPHLYLRRAMVLDAWLGSGATHRRQAGRLRIAAHRGA